MDESSNMSVALAESHSTTLFDVPNQTGSPERMLLLAVLERAILDLVGNDRREAKAAEDWIFEGEEEHNSDSNEPFTFVWVCSQLDLNSKEVAEIIKAMPKRGNQRIAPWYFNKKPNTAKVESVLN